MRPLIQKETLAKAFLNAMLYTLFRSWHFGASKFASLSLQGVGANSELSLMLILAPSLATSAPDVTICSLPELAFVITLWPSKWKAVYKILKCRCPCPFHPPMLAIRLKPSLLVLKGNWWQFPKHHLLSGHSEDEVSPDTQVFLNVFAADIVILN